MPPSLLGLGLSFLALYLVPSGWPFILTLAAMGAFAFTTMALMLTAGGDVVPRELQSTTVSLVFGVWIIFAAISPFIAGVIADAVGIRHVFLYASTIAVFTSLFALATPWQRQATGG